MGLRLHHKLELIGLAFLLIAAGAQLFSDDLGDLVTAGEHYRLNDKLNLLWEWNRELVKRGMHIDDSARTRESEFTHRFYAQETFTQHAEQQSDIAFWIYVSLYSAGTVSLIVGRYLDMRTPR